MQNKATPTASTQRVCRQLKTWRVIALGLFLGLGGPASGDLDMDVDGDGLNDVWQGIYDAWDLLPGGDEDGDGCSNLIESVAGTNPKVSGDCLKVGDTYITGTNVFFVFDAKVGKKYRILSSDTPGGGYGSVGETLLSPDSGTEFVATNDTSKTIKITKPVGSRKFYKLETSDVDSNSDGVSDWVAQKLGYDPNAENVDLDANGKSDFLDQLEGELGTPDEVTVSASNVFASEDGPQSGSFVVKRNRSLFDASVNVSISGTANPSNDYSRSPVASTVEFAVGEKEKTIFINPNPTQPATVEGAESVTLALSGPSSSVAGAAPVIGTPGAATVIINDTTEATGTGLLARYYDHASTTSAHAANFGDAAAYTYTRAGTTPNFTGAVVVTPTGLSTQRLAAVLAAVTVGGSVKLSFAGGNLNTVDYNHGSYTVTAKTGTSFTCSLPTSSTLPASSSSTCNFSILPLHPAVIERVDAVVDNLWLQGTPNGITVAAAAGTTATNVPDNYSDTFETFLSPATAGSYRFQLDADDRARVLLDLNNNGSFDLPGEQIVEHGWDSLSTVSSEDGVPDDEVLGVFKISATYSLAVPSSSSQRLRMRVEHVETTGESRCRLQWSRDGGTFGNIAQAEQFTHTQAITYAFTRSASPVTSGTATVTLTGHGLAQGNLVSLAFSNGNLFTPNLIDVNGYGGTYTVATVPTPDTFTVALTSAGSTLPATQAAGATGFLENRPASTTTGVYNKTYTNATFSNTPGRIGVDAAVTTGNSGIWGTGTPDATLINPDSFSVRWTGQMQPQYTEDYTLIVQGDDGVTLRINGELQPLRMSPSSNTTGSTYSYDSSTGDVVVNYAGLVVGNGDYVVGEVVRIDPASGNLQHTNTTTTYTYDSVSGDVVVDYSNLIAGATGANRLSGSFVVGETVELDPTTGNISSLATLPYVVKAASGNTFTVSVGVGLFVSGSGLITVADTRNAEITAVTPTTFTVNIGPSKYANASTGNMSIDIVNKVLKDWSSNSNERYVRIPMIGGIRYDVQLDYYENTSSARCNFLWYSPSQPRQVVPTNRLYPSSSSQAPPSHLTPTEATALTGGAFSLPVLGSNLGSVTFTGLPAWLTFANGKLTGTPPSGSEGSYQIVVTMTNAAGTGTSVIDLDVVNAGGTIGREVWAGIAGNSLTSIPTGTSPSSSASIGSLEAPSDVADNYGARIRGYITAPETGNYYFWIAGSDAAELSISNDAEPVNLIKRAWVSTGSSTPRNWNGEANQKSAWLALVQGKRYYVEILHKAGTGADNLAVGWLKPGQTGTVPSEVVPGFVLTPWAAPTAVVDGGTIYAATMRPQAGVTTNASGTSFLRVNAAETEAIISVNYTALSSAYVGMHVHNDEIPGGGLNNIIADLDEPGDVLLLPDGSFKWVIKATAGRSVAQLVQDIKNGKIYFNVHSSNFPNGEIKGYYSRLDGSQNFTPPAGPPAWTDDSNTNAGASRFLTQASFGPSVSDISALKAITPTGGKTRYELWIEDQFTKPVSRQLPEVLLREFSDANGGAQFNETLTFNAWWRNAITGPDQLRQRMAFALSETLVVSAQGPLDNRAEALSYYYDILADGALGNFRDLLESVTLSPAMGRYLDMRENDKPDLTIGKIPNENYAREIKQLFSVGLYRMWPDGSLVLNSKFEPVDTYTQREIVGFAHAFTGWDDGYDGPYRTTIGAATNWIRQMREVPARHYTGPKRILNNEVLPGLPQLGGQPLDPYGVHNSAHINQVAYQELPGQELDATHDQLFNHPNTGPFICRQLIQRLVTSSPSKGYVYRVVQKFNDNGTGVRGDLKAVAKAILLDYEARNSALITDPGYGKQREPVMRVAAAGRAFGPTGGVDGAFAQVGTDANGHVIKVTTTSAHKLVGGRTVFLEFERPAAWSPGDTTPSSATYTVLTTPAPTTNIFYVNAKGWVGVSTTDGSANSGISGTYAIPSNSTTMTVTLGGHWLPAGGQAYLDFESATGPVLADGNYTAATSTSTTGGGTTFTVAVTANGTARSGRVRMVGFRGSFTVSNNTGGAVGQEKRITLDTIDWVSAGNPVSDHHLNVGDQIYLNFTLGNPQPLDGLFTVESIPDPNTFTVLTSTAIATQGGNNDGDNGMWMFPLVVQPKTRSGTVSNLPSTFQLNSTDGEMEQTPLNSDTVFNFFLPDYKYAGPLASAGLTTPEFQLTAETSAVRQSNFFTDAIFNPSADTNGISSFRAGSHALVMDFSPWMPQDATNIGLGAPTSTTLPWTHNQNLGVLIDHLTTLLTAGQVSTEAKAIIKNFVSMPISAIGVGTPCTVTTASPHGYTTGDSVVVSGVTTGTYSQVVNNTTTARTITVTGANTFTLTGVNCTVAATAAGLTNAHVSQVAYSNGTTTPTDTEKRDRLRAIIHLILSSPDFIIQR